MAFEITLEGLNNFTQTLTTYADRIRNLGSVAANDVFLALQADVDQRFNNSPGVRQGGTVFGGIATWAPLTEQYLRRNPRRESGQLLRDSGELLQSYQVNSPNNIATSSPREIRFGSALPKARGLANAQTNPRPQVGFHSRLVDTIERVLVANVEAGL